MEAGNHMCETANCGELATVFIFKEGEKVKACLQHSAKGTYIIGIAGYDFISDPQDVADYEERKTLTKKGRRNLKALITICEKELEEAHQAIDGRKRKVMQTVESRFEEIKHAFEEVHTQVKAQLEELQANVEQFVQSKENQLSPAARLVCTDLAANLKLLKFGISDVSDHIAAELNSSWAVVPAGLCMKLACLKASQINAPIDALNETTMENETQMSMLEHSQQEDLSERKQLLQDSTCSLTFRTIQPTESVSLRYNTLEEYFAHAEYQEIKSLGLPMLQNYQTANLSAEQYWSTLLYVTYSMRQLGEDSEANDTFEEWRYRIEQSGTKLAGMLRLLTSGIDASFSDNKREAEDYLQQALRIGESHYPTSTFTALACFRLTFVCEENARERHHLKAKSLYEAISPKCAHAAVNLTNMGVFLFNKQRPKEAEEKVNQAQSILEIAAPKSIHAGKNLTNLGILQYMKGQWKEAEMNLKKAKSILKSTKSVDAAINYFYMGMLSEENNRKKEAIKRYSKAAILYEINGKREKQLEIREKITRLERQRRCWP